MMYPIFTKYIPSLLFSLFIVGTKTDYPEENAWDIPSNVPKRRVE